MRYSIDDAFNYEEEFETEIQFLMKKYNLKRQDIRILADHPCGEDVLYVKGKFSGHRTEYAGAEAYFYQQRSVSP